MAERMTGFLSSSPEVDTGSGGGRSTGQITQPDGQLFFGLLEWTAELNHEFLHAVRERIPTDGGKRPEEASTLKIRGHYAEKHGTAIVYECPQRPVDLREVLLNTLKPLSDDRRMLAGIIAAQVRSLHVHFQLCHPALRTESFVFFPARDGSSNGSTGDAGRPDLTSPYILDWGRRRPSPSTVAGMYQHPGRRAEDGPRWFHQAWSLMMVLSEIAEWKPINAGPFHNEAEVVVAKLQRKQLVSDPRWKNGETAAVFRFGFEFLDKGIDTLEQYTHWQVKSFYDRLCELLAPPAHPQ
ncbi:hypothetical protein GGR55DRAFT_675032 [Xylaria sp. FL0064]|nr:hypothetical protein GGR55DRAFT_675032 [Xylaria sp. FL0064]